MGDATTITLQIFSILVSGGLLQFATFLIKRSDSIRKLARVRTREEKPNEYQEEIAALKAKLRVCHRDLAAARRQE
jgi:hypothetical protein